MRYGYSVLLLFLLGAIWGSGYVIARIAMLNGIQPLAYSFWQSLGPALFLLLLMFFRQVSLPLNKKYIRYYLLCGLLGIALPNTNMYFAAPHVPAGLLAVIVNTAPVLTYFFALGFGQEKFNFVRLIGVGCAIAGILILVLPKSVIPNADNIPWSLFALATPIFFAVCAVYINAKRPYQIDSLALSAGMLISSTLLLLPLVLLNHSFYIPQYPFHIGDSMIFLEIVLSSIGYIVMFELLKQAGPVFYSLVSSIVLLTGLVWGWLIYGETLRFSEAFAVALILIAIFLISRYRPNYRTNASK